MFTGIASTNLVRHGFRWWVKRARGRPFFSGMSSPLTISAALQFTVHPGPLLAQSQQELRDTTQQMQTELLLPGGQQANQVSDFTIYVLFPFCVCLGLIVLGRRLIS